MRWLVATLVGCAPAVVPDDGEATLVPELSPLDEDLALLDLLPLEPAADPDAPPTVSSSGWASPLGYVPTYDCTYATGRGGTYTTLWADNQDGGAAASAAPSRAYNGSYCDAYDDISGWQYNGQFCGSHPGVDMGVSSGRPIFAIGTGEVYDVDTAGSTGWGKYVILRVRASSGGSTIALYASYAHLSSVSVSAGDTVFRGQQLGKTGNTGNSTGPHLHFQLDKAHATPRPYWPSGAPNSVDWSASLASYTYNPLTALGFGTCY